MKRAEIKVSLIDYTGAGHLDPLYAARLLAFTKATRLNMTPETVNSFFQKPALEILNEIEYMVSSIPSSWEFVDATFLIEGVSRACAQQITRTRWSPIESDMYGAYAMQSQRVNDISEAPCHVPQSTIDIGFSEYYENSLDDSMGSYSDAIKLGISQEDARGLLPMNVACNLAAKFNLRVLSELCRKRTSLRVQGEYNEVARQMREAINAVWPWSVPFFEPKEPQAIALIEEVARELPKEQRIKLAKAADLLKV